MRKLPVCPHISSPYFNTLEMCSVRVAQWAFSRKGETFRLSPGLYSSCNPESFRGFPQGFPTPGFLQAEFDVWGIISGMINPSSISYGPFWQAVHEFQTVVASVLGLISVAGALVAIRLQSYLASRTAQRESRRARVSKAVTLRALLLAEANFPEISLLATPTPSQVYAMLKTGSSFTLKATDYMNYLSTMSSSLTEFPRPISERASFLTWVSGRVLLASAQANAKEDEQALKKASEEIRLLLIAATETALSLAYELGMYTKSPCDYEMRWSVALETNTRIWHQSWKSLKSDAFDLEDVKTKAFAIYSGTYDRAKREGNLP